MNLRSLNVAPRAVLFFSVIVLIVFALGGVAVVQMGKLYDAEQEVETNWLPGNQLAAKMSGGLLRLRLESLRATTTPDPQLRAQTVAAFPGYREAFFTAVKDYERTVANAEDRQLYTAVVKGAESYRTLLDTFEPKLRAGDNEGAIALINTSIRPLTNALEKAIAELNAFNERGAKAAGQAAGATYAKGLSWVYGLIGLTIAATVVLAALLIGFRSPAGFLAWLAVIGILALFTLTLTWIAVIAGLSANSVDGASAFSYPIIFLPFISSAFVPTETMPAPVRVFAEHQPVTSIVETLRALLAGQPVGTEIWTALAWCVGALVLAYALAMRIHKRQIG